MKSLSDEQTEVSLSDDQIAVLCDVGDSTPLRDSKKPYLDELIARGFVEKAEPPAEYKLTGKAQQFLTERGVGLNEA